MPTKKKQTRRRRRSKTPTSAPTKAKVTLANLRSWQSAISRGSIAEFGMYGVALRAAISKSWEFASFTYRRSASRDAFFATATLRGVCEDLIAFSFLDTRSTEDRDAAISLLMSKSTVDGIAAQTEFFTSTRAWQPVLGPGKTSPEILDDKLRALASRFGWTGRQSWPSVWFMAKATSLEALYSYLYSATSRWVHFNPHMLLRMGWGGSEGALSDSTRWHFTTKNFSQYYLEFNQVYSAYLFLRLCRGPAANLVTAEADRLLTELEGDLSEVLRWPEIVTYEELNLKGPNELIRLLLWSGYTPDKDPEAAV